MSWFLACIYNRSLYLGECFWFQFIFGFNLFELVSIFSNVSVRKLFMGLLCSIFLCAGCGDVVVQWWVIWTPEKEALVQVLAASCFQTRCLHSICRLQNLALLCKDTVSCTVNMLSTFCSFFRLWWLFKNCQKLRHVNLEGNKSVRGQVMCLLSN